MNKQQFQTWLGRPFVKGNRSKPLLMGILNINNDSYNPNSRYPSADSACAYALKMLEDGADIIDIGGESSQPFIKPVSVEEELDRVFYQ